MNPPPGTILILNGASSSGKTCLLKALQEQIETPLLDLGLDRFIWALPKRYLERPLWDDVLGLADRAGETGHSLVSTMHTAIAAAARQGWCVAADHVLIEPAWIDDCARKFAGLPAWLVGLRCPLDILERRERTRKHRTFGQARLQFELVHAHGYYDLELDTSTFTPIECARQIILMIEERSQSEAFEVLRKKIL